LLAEKGIKKIEQFHFHIILDLGVNSNGKLPTIKSCRPFDIGGKKNSCKDYPNYHPNIPTVCNLDNSWYHINKMDDNNYLKEDGEEIFGDMTDPCSKGEAKMYKNNGWHDTVAAETKQESMDIIAKINPEKFILQNDTLESFADKRYGGIDSEPEVWVPDIPNPKPFSKIPVLEQWKKMFMDRVHKGRQVPLWLSRRRRIKKTSFAKSLGKHIHSAGILDSKKIYSNCDIIIFDDI
jgi:hypothetical protein